MPASCYHTVRAYLDARYPAFADACRNFDKAIAEVQQRALDVASEYPDLMVRVHGDAHPPMFHPLVIEVALDRTG